jgi:hypothetical protein
MGSDGDDEITETELLRVGREEAHRTLDKQMERLDGIDTKAAKILRLNLVLIGILLTGVSIIASNGDSDQLVANSSELLNIYTYFGIGSLLASTVLAALTYTSTNIRAGMSGRDIGKMISNDYSAKQNYRGMVESYSIWLQYNFKTNTRAAPLGTGTLLFLIYAIICISAGVFHAFIRDIGWAGGVLMIAIIAVVTWRSGIKGQLQRYWEYRDFEPGKE